MGKKGPLWWRESDWLLRGSSAANQILLRHSGPILSLGDGGILDYSKFKVLSSDQILIFGGGVILTTQE